MSPWGGLRGVAIRPTAMSTHASSDAFQPPRKEKSKSGFNNSTDELVLKVSEPAASYSRARDAGKNRRKTKPISIAHCCHGFEFVASLCSWSLRLLVSRPTNSCRVGGAIFKGVVNATLGCLCASPTFTRDADAFLDSVPLPTKSQPMANIWPAMDEPALQE